jgi:hypothetical protein
MSDLVKRPVEEGGVATLFPPRRIRVWIEFDGNVTQRLRGHAQSGFLFCRHPDLLGSDDLKDSIIVLDENFETLPALPVAEDTYRIIGYVNHFPSENPTPRQVISSVETLQELKYPFGSTATIVVGLVKGE